MEIFTGIRNALKFGIVAFLFGLIVGNFARDHWTDIMVYQPIWVIPVWCYVVPIIGVCTYLLFFTGGHHD
jgi:hypothetical protein